VTGTAPMPPASWVAARIAEDFGLTPVIGLEAEFYLLTGSATDRRRTASVGASGAGEAVVAAGAAAGVRIVAESGPSQHEMIFPPYRDVAELLDRYRGGVTAVRTAAAGNGTRISFAAKPFPDQPGSGLHVNVSLHDERGRNAFGRPDGVPEEPSTLLYAVHGMLSTMIEFMPVFAPTANCRLRYRLTSARDRLFCPSNVSWGGNNRSVALRIPASTGRPESRHIEHRVPSARCCPERAVAAVLLGVHLGLVLRSAPDTAKVFGIAAEHPREPLASGPLC